MTDRIPRYTLDGVTDVVRIPLRDYFRTQSDADPRTGALTPGIDGTPRVGVRECHKLNFR